MLHREMSRPTKVISFSNRGKFKVKMTFNDKHQQKQERQEFSRTSEEWIINPKYDQATGNNYDLCLVKLEKPLDLITGTGLQNW